MKATLIPSAAVAAAVFALASSDARADSMVIKQPKDHADYRAELEPHLDFAFLHYGGPGPGIGNPDPAFGNPEFGGGFRATIKLFDPAFIPKLNDTVGITFGLDLTGCSSRCTDHVRVRTPVGIQWNFYLTHEFSAFADLGFMLRISEPGVYPDFFAMAGARYLFSPKTAVTLRIGYPFVSLGVSFFAG